jgi:hypothetical protein
MPMTVPRVSAPLAVFSQISLAIQESPRVQPVRNLKHSQEGMPIASGIANKIAAPQPMPAMTLRRSPKRAMIAG